MAWDFGGSGPTGNMGANLLRPHSWFGLESPISPSDNLFKMAGKKKDDPAAPKKVVPLPDPTDAAVRRRQQQELARLRNNRGRSRTLLSGRSGDQSPTPTRSTIAGRG